MFATGLDIQCAEVFLASERAHFGSCQMGTSTTDKNLVSRLSEVGILEKDKIVYRQTLIIQQAYHYTFVITNDTSVSVNTQNTMQ